MTEKINKRKMKKKIEDINSVTKQRDNLLTENKQREAELAIISSVGEAMAKQLDVKTVTRIVGDKVRSIFDTEVTEILLLDTRTNMINVPYSYYRDYANVEPFPLGEGMTSKVINSGKPLVFGTEKEQLKAGAIFDDAVGEADDTESYMGVPIRIADKVIGVVSVQSYKKNAYSKDNVRLLSTLSSNMGIALENARLFEETKSLLGETQQRNTELGVINSVQQGLVAHMDIQIIYDLVGEKIREIFNAQVVSIAGFDHDKKLEFFNYVIEKGNRYYPDPRPLDKLRKHLIKTGELILINKDAKQAVKKYGLKVLPDTEMPKSIIFVPLVVGEKINGYISLQNIDRENAFSDSDVRLLTTLANSMSVALENARLFDETNQRNAELSILNALQEGLVMEMDLEGIINLVGDKLREALDFQDIGIRLYDKENDLLHFNYEFEHGERLSIEPMRPSAVSEYVLKKKEMVLLKKNTPEAVAELGISGMDTIPGTDRSKSSIAVPILAGNDSKGLIIIEDYEKEDAYSESDIRLLTTLANSMSIALENARLFEQTKKLLAEAEQRNTELSILNAIQEGLVKEMEFENIIQLVGDKLREALNYQDIGIRIYDKEKNLFEFPYEYEHGQKLEIEPQPPGAISGYILKNKKILLLKKNTDEEFKKLGLEGQATLPGTDRSKSLVGVPILLGNEVRGFIYNENYEREDAYSESDIRLLTTLANSMSVALENARLFDETMRLYKESEERASELATVNRISQAIAGHLEINKLIDMIGDNTRELFSANIAYVALLNKDTNMIEFPYGYGEEFPQLKYGEGLTSKIIKTREPLLLIKGVDDHMKEFGVARVGVKSASYLGVPIPIGNEITGVLSVQSTEEENKFTEDDMRMLNTIAAHVGIALNNANAYQELNTTIENLKSTQDQLVAQEKLASLGQLTAGIAHEIKNPLNFVNNFSELSASLVDELIENLESQKEFIKEDIMEDSIEIMETLKLNSQKIIEHGKRADSIVHSMLQHSRGKTSEKQLTDINSMLDEDLNLVYHGLRAQDSTFNISIKKEYDEKLEKLNVVPQDVSRAFLNILTNGCYEAHKKKTEQKKDGAASIFVKTINTKNYIEIRIRDNGNGIPKKIQKELFKPFFTTKPAGKGTGLGLSISYDIIVQEHKGELFFETEENEFTEFIIRLPKTN